jgi:hypothetical protein
LTFAAAEQKNEFVLQEFVARDTFARYDT